MDDREAEPTIDTEPLGGDTAGKEEAPPASLAGASRRTAQRVQRNPHFVAATRALDAHMRKRKREAFDEYCVDDAVLACIPLDGL
eukprot:5899441-Prymnesium_polylepis.2